MAEMTKETQQQRRRRGRPRVSIKTAADLLTIKKGYVQVDGGSDGNRLLFSCMYTVTLDGWNMVDFGIVDIPDGYALYLDAEMAGTEHEVLIVPKMFVGKDVVLSLMAINLSQRNFRTLYAGEQLVRGILVKTNGGSGAK